MLLYLFKFNIYSYYLVQNHVYDNGLFVHHHNIQIYHDDVLYTFMYYSINSTQYVSNYFRFNSRY